VTRPIDTERFSEQMRGRGVDRAERTIRITNFRGSKQEEDLSQPANCDGYGRVRHFRRATSQGWPANSLPIAPAARALGIDAPQMLEAQVFQNAVCNWRCWYCFVDFELLSGRDDLSSMMTADQIVALYRAEDHPPKIVDLTGGQPDLVPEWVPWMMGALERTGLAESVYLWSDDNLSNDYFWRYLDASDRRVVSSYQRYGKVCCFKGFDRSSFAFNTLAAPELFDGQFSLMERLLGETGIDLYAYATFTSPANADIAGAMSAFVDRLQELDPLLPLRTVPLEITAFSPVTARGLSGDHLRAMEVQEEAIHAWTAELDARFSPAERSLDIYDVSLHGS
jgi:uncharacterized Fe-S cluster-containing radical SAM superfamily protein